MPCLDEVLGDKPAAPPVQAALDTRPTASLPKNGGGSEGRLHRKTAGKVHAARPRLARREVTKPVGAPETAGSAKNTNPSKTVRVVAAKTIASIDQLAGKPVSFGPVGSPAQKTGRQLFASLNVKVEETPLDLDNALDGVATGDIAAVVVARPRDNAKVKALPSSHMHLLPTPQAAVARGE